MCWPRLYLQLHVAGKAGQSLVTQRHDECAQMYAAVCITIGIAEYRGTPLAGVGAVVGCVVASTQREAMRARPMAKLIGKRGRSLRGCRPRCCARVAGRRRQCLVPGRPAVPRRLIPARGTPRSAAQTKMAPVLASRVLLRHFDLYIARVEYHRAVYKYALRALQGTALGFVVGHDDLHAQGQPVTQQLAEAVLCAQTLLQANSRRS